jgi:hypothetical protein
MNEFTAQDYIAILIKKYQEDFGIFPFTASDEADDMIRFDIEDNYLNECYKYIPEEIFADEFEKFVNSSLENILNSLDNKDEI